MTGLKPLLKAAELADVLGVTTSRVFRWRAEHGLPAIAVGRSLYFSESAVRAWIEANTTTGVSSCPETDEAALQAAPPTRLKTPSAQV